MNLEGNTFRLGFPRWLIGKESVCHCRRQRFDLWVGKIPWEGKWQSILVFLPRKAHGQRSLMSYCHKESDTTEAT